MCLTQPATVLARFDNEVLVEIDGRNRLVTNLVVPDLRVGDEVLVGLGNVLTRITDAEAAAARELIDAALKDETEPLVTAPSISELMSQAATTIAPLDGNDLLVGGCAGRGLAARLPRAVRRGFTASPSARCRRHPERHWDPLGLVMQPALGMATSELVEIRQPRCSAPTRRWRWR